jgi:predicted nucleic acid-binding protein
MVKVFDLSAAPDDLRNLADLSQLRPGAYDSEATLMKLRVGDYARRTEGPANDCMTREVTWAEYRLHRWLVELGAKEGENVLLTWSFSRVE